MLLDREDIETLLWLFTQVRLSVTLSELDGDSCVGLTEQLRRLTKARLKLLAMLSQQSEGGNDAADTEVADGVRSNRSV